MVISQLLAIVVGNINANIKQQVAMSDDDGMVVLFGSIAVICCLFFPGIRLTGFSETIAHVVMFAVILMVSTGIGCIVGSGCAGTIYGGFIGSIVLWLWESLAGLRCPGYLLLISIIATIILAVNVERLSDPVITTDNIQKHHHETKHRPLQVELVSHKNKRRRRRRRRNETTNN